MGASNTNGASKRGVTSLHNRAIYASLTVVGRDAKYRGVRKLPGIRPTNACYMEEGSVARLVRCLG